MISLFAAEERTAKRDRLGDPLKVLDQAIDFAALARAVDARLVIGDSGRGGRPPYPTELMIRLLVVQQMYNLSDDALEYQRCWIGPASNASRGWRRPAVSRTPRRCGCGASD